MTIERKDCKAGNFCLKNFFAFSPPALTCKIFNPMKCLSQVNDYIEPIAIFITWMKIYSTKYICNARAAGLGGILVQ